MADTDKRLILIIGASGFLGSRLFGELSEQFNVIGTYFSRPNSDLIYLDSSDRKQVASQLKTIRPDILIDCGGMTRPDACESNQQRAYQTNVEGVANLVEFCNCKIIYFSTDYVFGGQTGQYTENDQPSPINYYGWTKVEAEKIVLNARSDNVVIRVSGLYGNNHCNNEFLSSLNEPVIYKASDSFSSNLLLDDVVRHLSFFCKQSGLYHFTDGESLSRHEFTAKAVHILEFSARVIAKPSREMSYIAQRPKNSSLISIRHNLKVCDSDMGLSHTKKQYRE